MDATKRPWKIRERLNQTPQIWDGETGICRMDDRRNGETEANARLIVKAVNIFDEMVDLLESYVTEWHNDASNFYRKEPDTLKCARTLLKRVKGE